MSRDLQGRTEADSNDVQVRVERFRERLLDFSKRNRLLNFRHVEKSRSHIRVIDEVPEFLYDRLISGGFFTFKPVPRPEPTRDVDGNLLPELTWQEVAKDLGIHPAHELPAPAPALAARHQDTAIQVPHFPDAADRKLEGIRQNYLTLLEEMGIPALFAVFGFLEWRESDTEEAQLAPLVLLPLELERIKDGYHYLHKTRAASEEPEINLSLGLRLKRMGIELPSLEAEDGTLSLSDYLRRVEAAVARMPSWRVRRFVTVGILQFARQVMYQDLEPDRWSAMGGPGRHPLVTRMISGAWGTTDPAPSVSEVTFAKHLIMDSDSSQRAAIAKVLAGHSMVIKGPPGTGKSQTISNLIAALLGAGRSVLFVAEKMAALDVVKKRLDDAGLGDFCLELHSTKARKKEVVVELRRTYDGRSEHRQLPDDSRDRSELQRTVQEIAAYEIAMATSVGALGRTLRDLIWATEQLRTRLGGMPERAIDVNLESVADITPEALKAQRLALDHLQMAWWSVSDSEGRTGNHPWRFVESHNASLRDQDRILVATKGWLRSVQNIRAAAKSLPLDPGLEPRWRFEQLSERLARLPPVSDVTKELVRRVRSNFDHQQVARLTVDLVTYQQNRAQLAIHSRDPEALAGLHLDIADLHVLALAAFGGEQSLDGLRGGLREHRRALAQLSDTVPIVQSLIARLASYGASSRSTPGTIAALLELQACISAGSAVLSKRNARTMDPANVPKYAALVGRAAELFAEREELDRQFSGWRDQTGSGPREHAITLRTTGWWGRLFSGVYRTAKTDYLRMTTGRAASRLSMADAFESLADFQDTWQRWPEGAEVRYLTNTPQQGMESDFQGMAACCRWAAVSQSRLEAMGASAAWAFGALADAPSGELKTIAQTMSDTQKNCLQWWVEKTRGSTLEAWIDGQTEHLRRIEDSLDRLRSAGLNGECRLKELPTIAGQLRAVSDARGAIEQNKPGRDLLGSHWRGLGTPVTVVRQAMAIREQIEAVGLDPALADYLYEDLGTRVAILRTAASSLKDELTNELQTRQAAEEVGLATGHVWPEAKPLGLGLLNLQAAVRTQEHLPQWVAFRGAWEMAAASAGPRDFLKGLDWSQIPPEHLADAYELAVLRNLCSLAQRTFPALTGAHWSGSRMRELMARFVHLDREGLAHRRAHLRASLAHTEVPKGLSDRNRSTDLALIQYEASKKTRHAPIRTLMKQAGGAVRKLKPCVMMSPLSVAQFLEPGALAFDVVVIDEASQMRPEDALGSLLRGGQVVVVGDNQQLPPTSFFTASDGDESETNDDGEADDPVSSMESILDLMLSGQAPTCDLTWHYRSRHESLINFSNRQFYDGRLNVFPSPVREARERGVSCRLVNGIYGGSINQNEAEETVAAALQFMRERPQQSLGVVAMNVKQADLIRDLLDERLRTADISYVERWKGTLEPFFVKNLENVQGDERDAIFVSMTYGPNEAGRVFQRFGPINGPYGHRRLNVLLTRAKYQLVLFTSMRAAQIELHVGSGRGMRVLHDYLEYAEHNGDATVLGGFDAAPEGVLSFGHLETELRARGLIVKHRVGNQGVRLPLAVQDPRAPTVYACAIDCDVGTDVQVDLEELLRFRPEMLSSLGWKMVRTWTSDWLRDPRGARRDFHSAVEEFVGPELAAPRSATEPAPEPTPSTPTRTESPPVATTHAPHAWAAQLLSSSCFGESRRDPKWDRLVLPLVTLLAKNGGVAPVSAVAQSLAVLPFRIQGVIAEVQEHLNVGQHEVIRFDRPGGQVLLDLELLRQLAGLSREPVAA
jgi:hypothetical protein